MIWGWISMPEITNEEREFLKDQELVTKEMTSDQLEALARMLRQAHMWGRSAGKAELRRILTEEKT
jgi:hypothetical protein